MNLFPPAPLPGHDRGIGLALAGLVLVAIVPLLVFGSGVAWLIIDQERNAVASELAGTASALRVAVDRELVSQFKAMEVLADDVSLDTGNLAAFRERARRAVAANGEWFNVALVDPRSHAIVAGAQPLPRPAPITLSPDAADEAARTRKPVIAGVFASGPITKKPVILFMSPVVRGNEVRYVLAVAMNPQSVSDVFRGQLLAASWTGAVVDSHMLLAGRSRDAARFIGVRATSSLAERIASAESGMFTALNQEGDAVHTVFSRSPVTGWSVVIGVPATEVEAPIQRMLLQLAGAGAALIALALIPAALIGKGIVQHRNKYEAAEKVVRENETKYRLLYALLANLTAQVPGVIFQFRRFPDGRICVPYASKGLREMYELEPEQVREDAAPALGLTHPEDYDGFMESMQVSARTLLPWHHEYRVVLPKQGLRWRLGEAQPERLADGSILWHGLITDITERKAAEARDHLLVSALEAVGDGVVITDAQARIEWANKAFETLTGYMREEAVGRRPAELVKSGMQEPSFYEAMWHTLRGGAHWRGELVNKRKDGSLYHEELSIAPVKDASGAISHFVGVKQDISKRKRMEAELHEMATTDILTGLPNRRHFMARLEEELARVLRLEHQRAAVLMLDLDHFKQVNDTYGHVTGDGVLKHFAALMREGLRKIDTGGRVGGEEFAIILPGADMDAARAFAERLRRKVAQTPAALEGVTIPMTVSIGIAAIDAADASPDAALIRADDALYRAKEGGRNRVEVAA